jgi:hypothetical protein
LHDDMTTLNNLLKNRIFIKAWKTYKENNKFLCEHITKCNKR